jgi:glycerol-3-phosphate dehydrogenase (NAD+)
MRVFGFVFFPPFFFSSSQFLGRSLKQIAAVARPDVQAISLIKGISIDPVSGPVLLSELITRSLSLRTPCGVLMGANVATEVAEGQFCEATIGGFAGEREEKKKVCFVSSLHVQLLMETLLFGFICFISESLFDAQLLQVCLMGNANSKKHAEFFFLSPGETAAIEMLGALKNIVALAAGFCDGLGCGGNTKAAIMRIGFGEMRNFIRLFGGGSAKEAYWESCGLADLITSCYGGRNRKVAELFAKQGGKKKLADIEKEVMNGQLLQGPGTLQEVFAVLSNRGALAEFPLFSKLHQIVFEGHAVETMLDI